VKVLVVGGGGREHALCWALRRDSASAFSDDLTLFAAPGNPGTAALATNLSISATAVDELAAAVSQHDIDVTIIGPEAPLAAGLADRLRDAGRAVFGPSAAAARLESSKAYAQEVMRRASVPTGASATFVDTTPALDYIGSHAEPLVVKASGLAAGKGAVVCNTRAEAAAVARAMLAGSLGEAGREIVIEEFLEGEELSVLALTDGERVVILPPAQDHKRLGEGDTGPNTGGMGAYCPVGIATEPLLARVRAEVFEPVLREVAAQGAPYEGVLYAGLMILPDGTPSVLEFNARFGDPETQSVLGLLDSPFGALLNAAATGRLADFGPLAWRDGYAVTVVLASAGYPASSRSGDPITGGFADGITHAGTALAAGVLVSAGGRVLAGTATGPTLADARAAAYGLIEGVGLAGSHYRRDIALAASRGEVESPWS
jgi:phosphoribosylamine--glycine ligase